MIDTNVLLPLFDVCICGNECSDCADCMCAVDFSTCADLELHPKRNNEIDAVLFNNFGLFCWCSAN